MTNPYITTCQSVCEANGLDAAVIVTIKAVADKAEIAVHGDGPNNMAVTKLKDVVATAISESIAAYKASKAAKMAKAARPARRKANEN